MNEKLTYSPYSEEFIEDLILEGALNRRELQGTELKTFITDSKATDLLFPASCWGYE